MDGNLSTDVLKEIAAYLVPELPLSEPRLDGRQDVTYPTVVPSAKATPARRSLGHVPQTSCDLGIVGLFRDFRWRG